MFIRVTTLTYDPSQEDQVIQLGDEQLIPLLRQMSGFVSYHTGVDRAAGRGVAISVWDNLDHAAGLRTAIGGLVQEFGAIGVQFEPAQVFELVRQV